MYKWNEVEVGDTVTLATQTWPCQYFKAKVVQVLTYGERFRVEWPDGELEWIFAGEYDLTSIRKGGASEPQ